MKLTEVQKVNRQMLRKTRTKNPKVGRLKKTLMYIDIKHLSYQQWVAYRKNYIGGSDVSTLLPGNINPYQSRLELYHEKVGLIMGSMEESEATYGGHCGEDYVIDNYWRWHNMEDPTHAARMIRVAIPKKAGVVRYCKRVKDVITYDPRFPHIQINIDGFIQNTRFEKAPRGILEAKTGLSYVWAEYEAGIPTFYIIQAQTYMLVTGLKYCEIAVLLDGRYFKVFPIEANPAIQETILEECKKFWDLVLEGRLIWDDKGLTEEEKIHYLGKIEPPVDNTQALDKYLKKRFRSEYKAGKMLITDELIGFGKQYLACNAGIAKIGIEKMGKNNAIKKIFLDNKIDEIIDGNDNILMTNRIEGSKKDPTLRIKPEVAKL